MLRRVAHAGDVFYRAFVISLQKIKNKIKVCFSLIYVVDFGWFLATLSVSC